MRAELVAVLACPVCRGGLELADRTLRCGRGHAFDLARQGHVTLLARPAAHTGDRPDMVRARERFLATGAYEPLSQALADAAGPHAVGGLVVDVGAGTGHHLTAVLDAVPDALGLALDLAVAASRRAARAHPRAGAVRCDLTAPLPLVDGCAAVVLDVFAPRNAPELVRILRPDGVLLVAVPEADHLQELVGPLGLLRVDRDKEARLAATLAGLFEPVDEQVLRWSLALDRPAVRDLVAMGPSAWHRSMAEIDALAERLPDPVAVTAAVRLSRWRPRRGGA